jgi:tripartite-type tricarboxylate transporter receptor subunit TctC
MRDFSPITNIINTQNIVVVNPSLPVHSVQELIAFAKSRQNPLNYGSAGIGTAMHLSVELFNAMTGIKMVHVPYRGGGPAINDLLAGRVDVVFAPLPDALPQVKAGRLRALAVTGKQRSPTVPELPTIAEAGVPGYDFSGWSGMFAPARTPPEIVTRLYAETLKILRSPEIKQRLSTLGAEPGGMPPPEFSAFVRAEIAKWGNVIKEAKIPQIK